MFWFTDTGFTMIFITVGHENFYISHSFIICKENPVSMNTPPHISIRQQRIIFVPRGAKRDWLTRL